MRAIAIAAVLLCACSSSGGGNNNQQDAPVGGQGGHQATEGGVGGNLADGGDGADVATPGDAEEAPQDSGGQVAEVHADATQESAAPCVAGARRVTPCDPSTKGTGALTSCEDPGEVCRPYDTSTACTCDPRKNIPATCWSTGVCNPGEFCCSSAGGTGSYCCGYDSSSRIYFH